MPQKLLDAFRKLFDGAMYRHRDPNNGDRFAAYLFEDIYDFAVTSNGSPSYVARVNAGELVYNRKNKVIGPLIGGIRVRRGDGLLGQAVPGQPITAEPGYIVRRGPVANVRIGVEVKIFSTAMFKQYDRVIGDIEKQYSMFKKVSPDSIAMAIVGFNHSATYRSYEGDKQYDSTPITEASRILERVSAELAATNAYNEVLFLPFTATNIEPFPFSWPNWGQVSANYAAAIVRLTNLFQQRFP